MIASGGLSGGLSSSIAGGSFADGFRQGIITSGLNHAMHISKDLTKQLNDELKSEFGDIDAKAPNNQNTLNRMMKLKTFKRLHKIAGGKVKVVHVNEFTSDNSIFGASATYTTLREMNGEAYTGSDNGTITFYNDAFSTYLKTAGILVHEFGHAISRHLGIFDFNYKKSDSWNQAIAKDELFAYGFQNLFGFSYYQTGTNVYLPGLQRAINKL